MVVSISFFGSSVVHLPLWTLLLVLHVVGFLVVLIDVLRHRRAADSALLWIFVAWFLSVPGVLLYLGFGVDRIPPATHKKNQADSRMDAARKQRSELNEMENYWSTIRRAELAEAPGPLGRYLSRAISATLPDHPLLGGNSIQCLTTGDETYPAMQRAIECAQHHIHLQSYIFNPDTVGRTFMDLLAIKASEGIEVRIMYDRFGSTPATLKRFFKKYSHVDGIQIVGFTQVNVMRRRFAVNLRNHRKILVVDGRIGFTGGTNIALENTTHQGQAAIHDYHFELHGPAVQELQYTFLQDWHSMRKERPEQLLNAHYFPMIQDQGHCAVRLINSGPTSPLKKIETMYYLAFSAARRQILAATPYFVPPDTLLTALRAAALRGIDVRLILPEKNNHFYAGLASRALYGELLECGVRIFERHEPFSHAKAVLIDDELAIIGSANLDIRSLRLNYETGLVVYGENAVNSIKSALVDDQNHSTAIGLNEWRNRALSKRLAENAASILTPLL